MALNISAAHGTLVKMSRYLMISCLVAVAAVCVSSNAIPIAPIIEHADHPRYAYNYAVNDPLTGDNKAQWESRDGGNVKGQYSLVEPDGTLRVVEYHADDLTGFNAIVKKVGSSLHPTPIVHGPALLPLGKPVELPAIKPLIAPLNYGFGVAPLAIGLPNPTLGHWSLPWNSLSGSYGGWAPLLSGPHATIISKKWKNGKLHKLVTGPIPLTGRKLVIRSRKGIKSLL